MAAPHGDTNGLEPWVAHGDHGADFIVPWFWLPEEDITNMPVTNTLSRRRDTATRQHGFTGLDDWIALLGRIALALIFLWSGYGKLIDIGGTVAYMNAHHMPAANVLIWPTVALELIGGAMLLVGWKARWAALALAAFTLLAGSIFHNFWAVPADQALNQTIHFMKNIAIVGGMLQVAAFGPGRYAIDAKAGGNRASPA